SREEGRRWSSRQGSVEWHGEFLRARLGAADRSTRPAVFSRSAPTSEGRGHMDASPNGTQSQPWGSPPALREEDASGADLRTQDAHRKMLGRSSSPMRVQKRNGDYEPVNLDKIVRAVGRCADGLDRVDALRVATKTISGLY